MPPGWRPLGSRPRSTPPYPILFVSQAPIPEDFTTIGAVFGNHDPQLQAVGRGGDLWIRYPNGALRNLTAEAGYGMTGFQGADSIAVRDPMVHWEGQKALFSMVIGAPTQQYLWETYHWQIYEVTGAGMWGTASSDPRYDRDGDGRISVVDVMLVASRWQEVCGE